MEFEEPTPNVGSNVGITGYSRPWELPGNVTEATRKQYRKRTKQLVCLCEKELGVGLGAGAYVNWLVGRMPFVLATTFRQYKAASIFMFHEAFLACEKRGDPIKVTALAAYWKLRGTYHDRDCPKPELASTSTGKK